MVEVGSDSLYRYSANSIGGDFDSVDDGEHRVEPASYWVSTGFDKPRYILLTRCDCCLVTPQSLGRLDADEIKSSSNAGPSASLLRKMSHERAAKQ